MNKYSVSVIEKTESADGGRRLEFEFENHDDLFRIVEKIKAIGQFNSEEEVIRFCVGLKLLGSVMIKHRSEELFKDFDSAFVEFMKKLKTKK